MTVAADAAGTVVTARRSGAIDIPFFGWFFKPMTRIAGNRSAKYALAELRHDLEGGPQPKAPAGVIGLPNVPFTHEQTLLLASASAAVAVVSFASALFGQLADPIAETFGVSDAKLSVALALTRSGAIVAIFATALADRRGRRRAILLGVVGSAVACGISAIAPTIEIFTVAQMLQRALRQHDLDRRRHRGDRRGTGRRARVLRVDVGTRGRLRLLVRCRRAAVRRHRRLRLAHPVRRRRAHGLLRAAHRTEPGRDDSLHADRGTNGDLTRAPARAPRPRVRPSLRAPRDHRVPRQRLQRAVVAADEQVPDGRPRLLELRHRAVPHGHHRAPRPHRPRDGRPARRAAGPQAGRDRRTVDRDVDADGLLPLRRAACCGSPPRSRC